MSSLTRKQNRNTSYRSSSPKKKQTQTKSQSKSKNKTRTQTKAQVTNKYHGVLEKIESFLIKSKEASEFNSNWNRIQNYWKAGKVLEHESKRMGIEEFQDLCEYISEMTLCETRTLQRIRQLYRYWPQSAPANKLEEAIAWTKYCDLLTVSDAAERNYYLQETILSDWSCQQLRNAIRQKLYSTRHTVKRYEGGLKRQSSMINSFWAQTMRVIDGDTILVKLDLRFGVQVSQELRLRGINCYELKDPNGLGVKAREFVEQELANTDWLLIVSYKSDKYGRYVADVYYSSVYESEKDLLAKGTFLNQRLLEEGLAKKVEY